MASTPQPTRRRFNLWTHLREFWDRVTEGLEISQLWKQFHTDARASYRFYRKDFDARAPQDVRRHNFWHTVHELLWAILEKLTPARRVLLLLGVLLLIFPDVRFYGGGVLLILLMLEIADRVVMKRDLEIARDIQSWLLPANPPDIPGLGIAFATRAANTVAGDYYDVFARTPSAAGESSFLIAVADVAGKSIPAALLMATFQASLKTLSVIPCSLGELVAGMNQYACSNSQSGLRFTTAFLAEFMPANQTLTYINAGHNAPVLRRSSGAIERLTNGGVPFGILADAPYQSGEVTLQSGDWLVIFTDGVVEAMNARGDEYGEARLLQVIAAGAAMTPAEMLARMMSDLDTFVGATPQHDDITCLLLKIG